MKCAGESRLSVIEPASVRELFYVELILDYIHIFEAVHLQFIMRLTDLTVEIGKLLSATGQNNPKFDAARDKCIIVLRTVHIPQHVIRFSCVATVLDIWLNGTFLECESCSKCQKRLNRKYPGSIIIALLSSRVAVTVV